MKNLHRLATFALVLFLPFIGSARAQTVPVGGIAVDGWSGVGVAAVAVTLRRPGAADLHCITGDGGEFFIGYLDVASIPSAYEVIADAGTGFYPFGAVLDSDCFVVASPEYLSCLRVQLAPVLLPAVPSVDDMRPPRASHEN